MLAKVEPITTCYMLDTYTQKKPTLCPIGSQHDSSHVGLMHLDAMTLNVALNSDHH